jgi:hypothetical protein
MPVTSALVTSSPAGGIGRFSLIVCSPCRIDIGLAPSFETTSMSERNDGTTAKVGSTLGPRPS